MIMYIEVKKIFEISRVRLRVYVKRVVGEGDCVE